MPNSRKPIKRKPLHKSRLASLRWSVLAVPTAVVLVLIIASFGFAGSMEENNSFCASCHTQPESTYFQRFQQSTQTDLAAFHSTKNVKCIDCHSGSGAMGRVSAIMEGSRNALAYYTRTAKQPGAMPQQMADDNCLKCHVEVYTNPSFDNHFHRFLTRWQVADPTAGCVTCHTSHTTTGSTQIAYLAQAQTQAQCERCHAALGAGN